MRSLRVFSACLPIVALCACVAGAQSSGSPWQKSYPVSGKASFSVSTGDASLEVRSCGSCNQLQIRVDWHDRRADDFTLSEFQSGNHVNFELKEKAHLGIRIGGWNHRGPEVVAEVPAQVDLEARTSDGALKVAGVQGNVELHTSDGSVGVDDVSGAVRLTASDGAIHMHNLSGTLESRSSDGSVAIEGRFTGLQVHAGDGSVDVTVADGSNLTTASKVEASDGSVKIHLARSLKADLDVHTSDGGIKCELPVTTEGFDSSHNSGHNLRGRLNGGGVPLAIHTSDGSVSITAI